MIVKLQRALLNTNELAQVLIYNEDHSVVTQLPLCEELSAVFGTRDKFYAEASLDEAGTLSLVKQVPDQPW